MPQRDRFSSDATGKVYNTTLLLVVVVVVVGNLTSSAMLDLQFLKLNLKGVLPVWLQAYSSSLVVI